VGTLAATAISSWNDHTCAVTTTGAVRCWGYNFHGELGNNSTNNSGAPVAVSGITSGATQIAAGWSHSCAVVNGGMRCWGENNTGQLGTPTTNSESALTPINVTGLTSGVATITAGRDGTCAVTTGGSVRCWGANYSAKIGNASAGATNDTPVQVTGLTSGNTRAANGYDHSCAATAAGVSCWGGNRYAQVGNGASGLGTPDVVTPVALSGFSAGASNVVAGYSFSCALVSGTVKCWGSNIGAASGETLTPTNKPGVTSGITAISAGTAHACAVTSAGLVRCWGENDWGELGNDDTTWSTAPVTVLGFQ
jgi:alpha-tubulin suppressor-like RCC1 family protein